MIKKIVANTTFNKKQKEKIQLNLSRLCYSNSYKIQNE